MKLKYLLQGLDCRFLQGSAEQDVTDICYDTRCLTPGALFVCLAGTRQDSHALAAEAIRAGAAALAVEHALDPMPPGVAVLAFSSTRRAMAALSAAFFGHPARRLCMIGVTGTKGKTTTTHLIRAVLSNAGRRVGLIGTNGVYLPGQHQPLAHTTPESRDLQALLHRLVEAGCDTCVMEVSSQGLKMERVAGIGYDVGVFTNLSPDHIGPGEHADFEEYRACKGRLFRQCRAGVVNADDENTEALLEGHTCSLLRYGFSPQAALRAEPDYQLLRTPTVLGVAFTMCTPQGTRRRLEVGMPGRFSIYNALAAAGTAQVLGIGEAAVAAGLRQAVVKGRTELVPVSQRFTVVIDYAHNEAAAENLLTTLRAYKPRRLVVVFGCGGNRSRLRRFGMGEVCARLADLCILTEDNSRFEPVEQILADIRTGVARVPYPAPCVEIPDRLEALHYALDHAQTGDLIAVIGKGHETYRDRNGVKTPFLERELMEQYAAQIGLC
ncbi:MAG: UDP-N-acetylmuramoyl-L-alanyl-D-glutamate--2,6-diaminopimelate ligase [Gemmiger sp.]